MRTPLYRSDRAQPFPIKYTCTKPHALGGMFATTDLHGKSAVVRRCSCLRGVHVDSLSDPRNGADALGLAPTDYLDPADAPRRDAAPSTARTAAQAREAMIERGESAWRTPRRDSNKYTCLDNGDGRFIVVDLNGKRSLIRRCCCAGGHHVVDVQDARNAADVNELRQIDFVDAREMPPILPGRVDSAPTRTATRREPNPGLFARGRPAPGRCAAQARAEMIERNHRAGRDPIPQEERTMNGKRVDWP